MINKPSDDEDPVQKRVAEAHGVDSVALGPHYNVNNGKRRYA